MPLSCQAGVLGSCFHGQTQRGNHVRNALCGDDMRGLVRAFVGGEDFLGSKRRDLIGMCKALEDERHAEGNAGVTVVVLR